MEDKIIYAILNIAYIIGIILVLMISEIIELVTTYHNNGIPILLFGISIFWYSLLLISVTIIGILENINKRKEKE